MINSIDRNILQAVAKAEAVIAKTPKPEKWRTWAVYEWEDQREFGPLYVPSELFGDGEALPERARALFLRHVHAMSERGLLDTVTKNRRLRHIKLTAEGNAALAAAVSDNHVSPEAAA